MRKNNTLLEKALEQFPDSSRRTVANWIKNGRILVNQLIVTNPLFQVTNEAIELRRKDKIIDEKIKIIYEDKYIVIIDKPDNLLSVPAETTAVNALKILRKHFQSNEIFAVHRIDLETSGLLLFAKTKKSMDLFKEIFKKHDITRKYLGVVEGHLNTKRGTLQSYLKENEDLSVSITDKYQGKLAITEYNTLFETVNKNKKLSFLSLSLKTGKKHQIRVQLKDLGHPILGDKKYGKKEPSCRMFLHAYLLSFVHPFFKKKCTFISQPPIEFQKIANKNIVLEPKG